MRIVFFFTGTIVEWQVMKSPLPPYLFALMYISKNIYSDNVLILTNNPISYNTEETAPVNIQERKENILISSILSSSSLLTLTYKLVYQRNSSSLLINEYKLLAFLLHHP